MTRFLMSLDEAVLLVEHAFEHARPGDLFIRKAPASTIEDLALAVGRALGVEPEVKVIGTRHGEKLYETLATREELTRAEDQGDYFRVSVDARNLNYGEYFDEGDRVTADEDYHSHNTEPTRCGPGRWTCSTGLPDFGRLVGRVGAVTVADPASAARASCWCIATTYRHPAVRRHPARDRRALVGPWS